MPDPGNHRAGGTPVLHRETGGDPRTIIRLARDFAHRPLAMIGLGVLVVAALDTVFAPLLLFGPSTSLSADPLQPPSFAHPLGADDLGRDELARLLVGIHSSALFAGMALGLALVLGIVVLAGVRLAGRTQGREEWDGWAQIILLPVIGVILLSLTSFVAIRQLPANFPSLLDTVRLYLWEAVSHPFSLGTNTSLVLVDLLVIGEVTRFGYLMFERLQRVRVSHVPGASGSLPTPCSSSPRFSCTGRVCRHRRSHRWEI